MLPTFPSLLQVLPSLPLNHFKPHTQISPSKLSHQLQLSLTLHKQEQSILLPSLLSAPTQLNITAKLAIPLDFVNLAIKLEMDSTQLGTSEDTMCVKVQGNVWLHAAATISTPLISVFSALLHVLDAPTVQHSHAPAVFQAMSFIIHNA